MVRALVFVLSLDADFISDRLKLRSNGSSSAEQLDSVEQVPLPVLAPPSHPCSTFPSLLRLPAPRSTIPFSLSRPLSEHSGDIATYRPPPSEHIKILRCLCSLPSLCCSMMVPLLHLMFSVSLPPFVVPLPSFLIVERSSNVLVKCCANPESLTSIRAIQQLKRVH